MMLSRYFKGDKYLWAMLFLLALASILMVYSASSNLVYVYHKGTVYSYLTKHVFYLFMGFVIIFFMQLVDYKYIGFFSQIFIFVSIALLILAQWQGNTIEGVNAARWIRIPGINLNIQPSTIASLNLLIYAAYYLARKKDQEIRFKESIVDVFIPAAVIIGLIIISNGSTGIFLFTMLFFVLFVGGYPKRYLVVGALAGFLALSAFLIIAIKFPNSIKNHRVHTWISRVEHFSSKGEKESYQVKRAKAAIVRGGTFGVGPGKSVFKVLLPQSSSDFIYAVIIEEYGLIGAGFLLFVYMLVLWRFIVIATKTPSPYGSLLVISVGIPLIAQALLNMSVAVNLVPVTGQTLPLISTGGTSIWTTCIALGIILSISRTIPKKGQQAEIQAHANESFA